jgi:ferrochelatase
MVSWSNRPPSPKLSREHDRENGGETTDFPCFRQLLVGLAGQDSFSRGEVGMYDAVLWLSFGGPEGPDDVMPFLENVLRGRNVPRERMLEVAEHYQHFGGVSPINDQNRALIAAVEQEFARRGVQLPIYWGNRNWHPMLTDTMQQMKAEGVGRALAFVTSAFSSYSGCRQYREDVQRAQAAVGEGAPHVDKIRVFYNHPEYVGTMVERVQDALATIPDSRRAATRLVFTAHSIPQGMSDNCRYVLQLQESCRLVAEGVAQATGEKALAWKLVYQSRSGPPTQPWLEPDVVDYLEELSAKEGVQDAVVIPIGFISDHMEVLYDLDTEAAERCHELGLNMVRAATAGTHPRFVSMIVDLILERMNPGCERPALGPLGASHDVCPVDCCLSGRPAGPPGAAAGGPPAGPPAGRPA